MKPLKESFITKKNIDSIVTSKDFIYLFIPKTLFVEYDKYLGKPTGISPESVYYWIIESDKIQGFINDPKVKSRLSENDCFYILNKKEFKKYSDFEFSKIIDTWEPGLNKEKLNNWPGVSVYDLQKQNKKSSDLSYWASALYNF